MTGPSSAPGGADPSSAQGGAGPARARGQAAAASGGIRVVVRAVVRRPDLWLIALGQGLRLGRQGWWRRWPPIPEPTESLWHLRMLTAYGGNGSELPRQVDVVSYLEWCQGSRQWRRG
jgi:hypothetical protein